MILKSLVYNEEYFRKVIPFLKPEYFTGTEKLLFTEISQFALKYNNPPSTDALSISVKEKNNLSDDEVDSAETLIKEIEINKETSAQIQWLVDKTEKFCQEKAIYNAVLASISILDGKDKHQEKGAIPKLLSDALAVGFDSSVGHDYLDDAEDRFDFYHEKQNRIPFDLEYFNKITKGGIPPKTLNIILAGTNVGKSLIMCHFAASYMVLGKNVLYITMEMAEEEIAKRIDANLLNLGMDELMEVPKDVYVKKVDRIRDKTVGKLIIKEYPTAAASTVHFRTLINELNLKKSFVPDVIIIDYLNICTSARIKPGNNVNSYTFIKAIAEELRGLAVEMNVPIWSATQTTRSGYSSSDVELEDTSESFGLPATADFMFAAINSEELEQLNQLMMKQLKSRYGDKALNKRFVVGIDRQKMRLYDVEQVAHEDIADSGQDKPLNTFGKGEAINKSKFAQFKV